jgi:hypothetical protein
VRRGREGDGVLEDGGWKKSERRWWWWRLDCFGLVGLAVVPGVGWQPELGCFDGSR